MVSRMRISSTQSAYHLSFFGFDYKILRIFYWKLYYGFNIGMKLFYTHTDTHTHTPTPIHTYSCVYTRIYTYTYIYVHIHTVQDSTTKGGSPEIKCEMLGWLDNNSSTAFGSNNPSGRLHEL